ncbi:hypothetical protein FXN80_02640 [Dickeya fangzhongdai]|uniref:hypothetical protein n=1 Tax=Dickeya fangzhongdai TaxID=1778540 RepID=UPI001370C32F|nr:hypothetical protein [Dickeya fangzhongdai]UMB77346.1 hypothetical protein FXN80_02640 [Dickeya fangzhongdai]
MLNFPSLLTQESLDELRFVVESVCDSNDGRIYWKGPEIQLSEYGSAVHNRLLLTYRLEDGVSILSTAEPEALRTWFQDVWCPLHHAVIKKDGECYRKAAVSLLQKDMHTLICALARAKDDRDDVILNRVCTYESQNICFDDNLWASLMSIMYYQNKHAFSAAKYISSDFGIVMILHRFGKEAVFNYFVQSKLLRTLDQFQPPLLLLRWIYGNSEAALNEWVARKLPELQSNSLSTDFLLHAASIFTELLRTVSLQYGWPLAMKSIQWEPTLLSLPARQYARTPQVDRIQGEMFSGPHLHSASQSEEQPEPEKSSGLGRFAPLNPVQSIHPDAEEETDDPTQ